MSLTVVGSGNPSAPNYPVQRSVRLRSSASAYFNRVVTSTSNTALWTYSEWVKLGVLSIDRIIFGAGSSSTEYTTIYFDSSNRFNFVNISGGVIQSQLISTPVYRDPSGFYHLVFTYDSAQATSTNRLKLYINGVQVTVFTTATYPSINAATYINNSVSGGNHFIGKSVFSSAAYFDGYMAEMNFIDGQALTPSSFGAYNSYGVWSPAKYSGTYGTNGFYLNFQDNSAATAAAIGKDSSGNGNNWTPNNISVTAGVTYDSMLDVPTLTSANNSNYCTLNQLRKGTGATLSEANLTWSITLNNAVAGTIGVSSGKWYWEVTAGTRTYVGIVNESASIQNQLAGINGAYCYAFSATIYSNGGTSSSYGATYTSGDIIGVALDMDAGTITFYKNNTSQGVAFTSLSGIYFPATGSDSASTATGSINFGQRPFTYTPPTGFNRLNTFNLPNSVIPNGAAVMAATTFNGVTGGGAVVNTVNGVGFKPDFVWMKCRNVARNHELADSVRGTPYGLFSNLTNAEVSDTRVSSFNANGFNFGTNSNSAVTGDTEVAWQWQAGQGTTSTNTSGSIPSTVSVNSNAGFSVVTYTGTGANATVGHGLGVAPKMIIVKNRGGGGVDGWVTYHASIGNTGGLILNTTAATQTSALFWNNTSPTSNVFTVSTSTGVNASTNPYVAYCWAEIAGFSKFGSYTGNGSADGPFVYCGFRPRFVMFKASSAVTQWVILDTSRDTYNAEQNRLYPNLSNAEDSGGGAIADYLSNGFKLRQAAAAGTGMNESSTTYIYAAFAENPFKNALAR